MKYDDLPNVDSNTGISGMGYLSLSVCSFSFLKSITNLWLGFPLSCFDIKGLLKCTALICPSNGLMKFFDEPVSINNFSSLPFIVFIIMVGAVLL